MANKIFDLEWRDTEVECPFCNQFRDCIDRGVSRHIFEDDFDRILYQDNDFVVVPTLGPLVEGWLMIIPRDHILSIRELPVSLRPKLLRLKRCISEILGRAYSDPIFFEHGSLTSTKSAGACVVHAHLHALPRHIDIISELATELQLQPIHSLSSVWDEVQRSPYLYLEVPGSYTVLTTVTHHLPCQYLRRLIATKLGCPHEWDWRRHPHPDRVRAACTKLRSAFKEHPAFDRN